MNEKLIPRRYRKYVVKILKVYKVSHKSYGSLKEYVNFLKVGAEDGWLKIDGNKEYQSIIWLHGIIELLEGES